MCKEVRLGDLPKGVIGLIRGLSREAGWGIVDGGTRNESHQNEEEGVEYPEVAERKPRKTRKLDTTVVPVKMKVVKLKGGMLNKKRTR